MPDNDQSNTTAALADPCAGLACIAGDAHGHARKCQVQPVSPSSGYSERAQSTGERAKIDSGYDLLILRERILLCHDALDLALA